MTREEWDQMVEKNPESASDLIAEKVCGWRRHKYAPTCWIDPNDYPFRRKIGVGTTLFFWSNLSHILEAMENKGFDYLITRDEVYFEKGNPCDSSHQLGCIWGTDMPRPQAVATAAMIAIGEVEPLPKMKLSCQSQRENEREK